MNRWLDIFCLFCNSNAFFISIQHYFSKNELMMKKINVCRYGLETSLKCFHLVESLQIKPLISEDKQFLHHEQHLKNSLKRICRKNANCYMIPILYMKITPRMITKATNYHPLRDRFMLAVLIAAEHLMSVSTMNK